MSNCITRKSIFMSNWRSKLGFFFDYKSLEEFESIIDFYENRIKESKEQLQQRDSVIEEALYYISNYTSKSEVNISGLPKCNIFKGSIDELLDILNKYKKEESR